MNNKISRRSFLIGGTATALGIGAIGLFGSKMNVNADTHKIVGNTKWIWVQNPPADRNDYGEFISEFTCSNQANNLTIEIACDTIYAVYINNDLACFAQCSDFGTQGHSGQQPQYKNKFYKLYDRVDISKKCKPGKNDIRIIVWHNPGTTGCQTFVDAPAGLIFQIFENDKIICYSNQQTQSRALENYWFGESMWNITGQLGYSFRYDRDGKFREFTNSTIVDKPTEFHLREILPLELGERVDVDYQINSDTNTILVKMPEETVGFLDIDINNPTLQVVRFSYGEHTCNDDGTPGNHVRAEVGGRRFYVDVKSDGKPIKYMNPLRRLGAKYIEISVVQADDKHPVKPLSLKDINYVGLRPVNYPLEVKPMPSNIDDNLKKIYKHCILTLKCSMHEHYEDCPWREQCLYGMDSRNQMLCGYYAFEGHEYQRHNLILLANSLRMDGIIEICSPCNNNYPIPMFSYAFIIAVAEYLEHTKDFSILKEIEDQIEDIFNAGKRQIDDTGLLRSFDAPAWNFYEWWSNNRADQGKPETHDTNLNAIFIIAHEAYKAQTGKTFVDVNSIRNALDKYNLKDKFYQLGKENDRQGTSQLVNATAILADAPNADKSLADILAEDIKLKWQDPTKGLEKASLSMKAFLYDALLKFNDQKYVDIIKQDIKYCYNKMMNAHYFSGTFWEDEEGQAAFANAGSLCHGWSAIPVYYIWKYFK